MDTIQIINLIFLCASFGVALIINYLWVTQMYRLNDDWHKRAEEVSHNWHAHCLRIIEDHRKQTQELFDVFTSISKQMEEEHAQAFERLHEGWRHAVKMTLDQLEGDLSTRTGSLFDKSRKGTGGPS